MLQKYIDDYLSVNLNQYDAFGIDLEISKVVLIALAVFCVACFAINHHRSFMAMTMKKFFRHKAFSEDSAMTLRELGLDSSRSLKRALVTDSRISKIVKRVGEQTLSYEEYRKISRDKKAISTLLPNFESDKFYIAESEMDNARNIHDNYTGSIPKTAFFCLLLAIIFVSLTLLMPGLLSLINGLISGS